MVAERIMAASDEIGTQEAADILEVSKATVLRIVFAGDLTPIEPINRVRGRQPSYHFVRSDVEYLRDHPETRTLKQRGPRPKADDITEASAE